MRQKLQKARRSPKAADEFENARAKVRKRNNPAMGLRMLRKEEPPAKLYRLAGRFARHAAYRSLTLPYPFPRNMSELAKNITFSAADFETEFAWLASLIRAYNTEIQDFASMRKALEIAFLSGDLSGIEVLHEQAEAKFGQSVWLTESRLNYFDLPGVSGGKTRYSQSVRDRDAPVMFNYLVSWVFYRTASGVSAGEVERLQDHHWDESPSGFTGVVFGLNGRYLELNETTAAEMLNYSDTLPLVDRYQVMLLALQCLLASGDKVALSNIVVRSILADLSRNISDPQLHRLARAFGVDVNVPLDNRVLALLDDYHCGRFDRVIEDAGRSDTFHDMETLEVLLRANMASEQSEDGPSAEQETRTLYAEIRSDLSAVLGYVDEAVEARLRLQKLILTHCNTSWAASLRLILDRQSHDERVLAPTRVQTVFGLRSTVELPNLVLALPAGDVRNGMVARHLLSHPHSGTVAILTNLCGIETGTFSPDVGTINYAVALLRSCSTPAAIEQLKELAAASQPPFIQLEASRLLATAYWRDRQVEQMANITASLFVRSRYFGAILPISDLVAELLKGHDEPMPASLTRGKLSVAIVYDIYSRYVSSKYDAERADAFKDVLRANGVKKASELGQHLERFLVSELAYFLRFVCVPDVLDQSLVLDTSRAVEDERVAILLLISELTAGIAPSAIKDELREIRTRQVVRETTLRLDESKIYVNIEGIRRSIDVSMRDDWNRYRLMNDGMEQTLFNILEQVRGDKTDPVRFIFANPTERFALLRRMISILRDEFTMNKEFGLNSNLSTNIRHGYVEREIRGPLLARNLVTNKDTDSGSYLRNNFWLDRLEDENPEQGKRLSAIFDKFSARIDDEIDRVNRQLLRIQSETTPHGLFKYGLSDSALMAADNTWSTKETFDEFIDAVFSVFWDGTQRNLGLVRDALSTVVLTELINSLTSLGQDISVEGFDQLLPDLEHAITMVQTEMRSAIDRVASWFTLSSNNEYQDFDLAIAFQAGMNTVKTYFRNISITEDYRSNGEIIMNGWCLPIFARLFFLILDNAATHGARSRPTLKISMLVEVKDTTLFIKATNDLPADHDNVELRRRVSEIRRDYGQAKAMELLSEEGGSGYPKIWKLLKTDLRRDHDLFVEVTDSEFSVEILLPTAGIINETPDS
ncbi:hypothetical protein [Rhizobium leguminosarum]|uniref:Uncharacterized protein n=1 Tax=Rhizobium leguminosarum TaxID=384 RepID=A0A7K3VJU9_RHILE|nr:hypothetical protein [Rhizobium leguminosarum]NEK17480.1 hypothetical protein [Rhizobium leguminosarum]